jgi:glycosyltransferase 2 family protein
VIVRLTRSLWVRALVTAAVLVLLASRIDLRATGAAIVRLDPGLALVVVLLVAADRAIMIWRWIILLRARGTAISARSATSIYLVSSFIGGYTALAGDAARAYTLSRQTAQGSAAVASVAVDRLLGLLSILVVALMGIAVAGGRMIGSSGLAFGGVAAALAAGSAATLLADRWVSAALPAFWRETGLGRRILRLAEALGAYRGHHGAIAAVSMLSIGVQLLRVLQAYGLGRAIGIDVPFSYYLLFMPAGLIALMMPISLAGFGAPQGLIVWLLRPRGVPVADALALSTLIVLSGILANLPGGALYVAQGRDAAAATR